jgi:hypothetical protein
MRFHIAMSLALIGLGLQGTAKLGWANLVQNGGFENGTYNATPVGYPPDDAPDDWSVNTAFALDSFIDGVRTMPYTGTYDLQMGPGGNPPESLNPVTTFQTFSDTPGQTYTVSFYLYTTLGSNISTNDIFQAQIDGVNGFDLNGIQSGALRSYTQETFNFTGTGSDTLTFAVTDISSQQPVWEIDDVSVTPASSVPEPSAFPVLAAGLTFLVLLGRRRLRTPLAG